MTDIEERCSWSDLPRSECHHCNPEARPHPTPPQLRVVHPVAQQATAGISLRDASRILDKAARAIDLGVPATTQDYVQALTEPTTHHEAYSMLVTHGDGSATWVTERHRTISLPLLEQLASAAAQSGSIEQGKRAFQSTPSARIDALDVLNDIEREVLSWLRRLHLSIPDNHDLAVELRRAAANAGHEISRDVKSWWIRARVVTGWDSPAWRPDNTCPLCSKRGGLRVRVDATGATCVECGEAWDEVTIGLLAEHIRRENHDEGVDNRPRDVGASA